MAFDEGLVSWVEEAMAPIGTVTKRAMMGGATLYCDGIIFALIGSEGALWFKADATSDAEWDAAGCERFSFTFDDGRTGSMNYRRAPDTVHDDADDFRRWAALALEAGHRAPRKAKGAATPRTRKAGSSPKRP